MFTTLINTGTLFTAAKIFVMILYRLEGWFNLLANMWGFDETTGLYFGINKIYNNGEGYKHLWGLLGLDVLLIILMIVWLVSRNKKTKMLIIEHSSLQRMSFTYNNKELEDYAIKKIQINQYATINDPGTPLNDMIFNLINDICSVLPTIYKRVERGYQVCYAGIANIPATFLLGYELGDENKKQYFHKYRNDCADDDFHLLKSEPRRLKFESTETPNKSEEPGKILLLVELTKPISSEDISNVLEENDYIIKYFIPQTVDYDVIDSAQQINQYSDEIANRVTEIQKIAKITEIKICIAASSSFIFGLGTKFSKTQNKSTVIFHFQNDTYPWGINVTSKAPVILKDGE